MANKTKVFLAPDNVKSDPGLLFKWTCEQCLKITNAPALLVEHFNVSRQTIWHWRQSGRGVPPIHSEKFRELFNKTDGDLRLTLPDNVKFEDYLYTKKRIRPLIKITSAENEHLLGLLDMICTTPKPGFGRHALWRLVKAMQQQIKDPHIFYRWGYYGGVPPTYAQSFIDALIFTKIYLVYDADPTEFRNHAMKRFVSTLPNETNED